MQGRAGDVFHVPARAARVSTTRLMFSNRRRREVGAAGLPFALIASVCVFAAPVARAQDLEPRAYAASPAGAVFVVVGLARSTGGVVTDPTLPVTNIDASINGIPLGVGYTFGVLGKLALATFAVPVTWGDVSGDVGEDRRTVERSGLADARAKFSINLVGNPAMGARAFAVSPRQVIIGTSVTVIAPTGQYSGDRLINLGTNRWATKPEVGVSVPKGAWDFDAYAGVWLFADNADYFPGGNRRTQDPVLTMQGHVSYTVRPRLWVAFDATWYRGGIARVNGGNPSSEMNNSRLGATVSLPIKRSQSFKVAYSSGVSVRTGSDFRTLSFGWQKLWLTKR